MHPALARRLATAGAIVASSAFLAAGVALPAQADDAPFLKGVVSGLTLHNGAPDPTDNPMDVPEVVLYNLQGSPADGAIPDASGAFSFDDGDIGKFKLALRFDADNLLQKQTLGKHDVSYFYSTSGPTSNWSKATVVTLKAGETKTIDLQAVSGRRLKGTLEGRWINGADLYVVDKAGAPADAIFNDGSVIIDSGSVKRLSGDRIKFTFTTTSLLKGSYKIFSADLDGKHTTTYYAGSKKKATAKASKAKVVKVSKASGSQSIGTFKAN